MGFHRPTGSNFHLQEIPPYTWFAFSDADRDVLHFRVISFFRVFDLDFVLFFVIRIHYIV